MPEALVQGLREVADPEMPVNIVDLGLVYGVRQEGGTVLVDLTFTAMGCPATDMILSDIKERLLAEPGVSDVKVEIVWDPPWTTALISDEGLDALRMWGLAV